MGRNSYELSDVAKNHIAAIRKSWEAFDALLDHKDVVRRAASIRFKFALEDIEHHAGMEVASV